MRKAYLQMHIAIVLWGFTAILGKLISLDEGLLVWYRMLFSTVAMAVFLAVQKKQWKLPQGQFMPITLIGLVITLHWITFYGAIKASNVSIAISCFSSVALFTAVMDPLLKGKRPKASELLLGLAVIAGIYIIFTGQKFYFKGIVLSVISAFLASLFTILNKRISNKIDPAVITFYELGTGFLLLTILLPAWMSYNASSFSMPDVRDLQYILILSIFCTTVAFTLSLHALQKIDAFTMNLSVNLEPLYSIILAFLIFKEHELLTTQFYIGSALILSAVVIHGIATMYQLKKRTREIN
jgi:drug/metabolite transporter (DMT)-like permease